MSRTPSLANLIRDAMRANQREMHTAMVAEVVAYDVATQTADVQPLVKRVFVDPDGIEVSERYPQIPSVPVAFLGGGSFFQSAPIQPGDHVLLVFCERAIDQWWAKGRETDPGDLRMHAVADAVAIPCVRAKPNALADADAATLAMGKDGGGPQIHISDSTVALYAKAASDWIALASLVDARFSAIESALATAFTLLIAHVHTSAAPGSPTSPSPTLAALSAPSGSSTASTKVKAE